MCQRFHFQVKVPSSFMVSLKVVAAADINLGLIQCAQAAFVLRRDQPDMTCAGSDTGEIP